MQKSLKQFRENGIKITEAKEQIYVTKPTKKAKKFLRDKGWEYIDDGLEDIFKDEIWERRITIE